MVWTNVQSRHVAGRLKLTVHQSVTQETIDTYSRDGVVMLKGAISQEWIETLRRGIELNIATPSRRSRLWNRDAEGRTTFYDSQVWNQIPEYKDFVLNSPMAEIAGRVMDVSGVNFFFDAVFVRTPGVKFRTPFHQDEPFWSVIGFDTSSVWTPLVPVAKTSALEFVSGSHRWPEQFAQVNFGALTKDDRDQVTYGADQDVVPLPDIEGNRDQYDILSWDMEPGDIAVFNARIVHGGSGNLDDDRDLKVFNTQWLGDDVRVFFREEGMDPDHSAEMTEVGLAPGDKIGTSLYPRVWER